MEVAHRLAGRYFSLEIPTLKQSKQLSTFENPTIILSCSQPVTIRQLLFDPGFASSITSLCNGQAAIDYLVENPISVAMELALEPETQFWLVISSEVSKVFSKEVTPGFVIGEDGAVWQVHGGNTDVLKRVQYTIV